MKKALLLLTLLLIAANITAFSSKDTASSIYVYRFEGFPEQKAKKLANALKTYFPRVVYCPHALALPKEHYNKERNRYLGSGLFNALNSIRGKNAAIGLTDYVIYKPNEISQTFGIMGVSPVGKYICVVSDKIPKGSKTQSDANFLKLSLHELGHSFGLPHCQNQHCFMVDAEHKMKFPQTYFFCPKCKSYLNSKGWSIGINKGVSK